jgi:uridine kinase
MKLQNVLQQEKQDMLYQIAQLQDAIKLNKQDFVKAEKAYLKCVLQNGPANFIRRKQEARNALRAAQETLQKRERAKTNRAKRAYNVLNPNRRTLNSS